MTQSENWLLHAVTWAHTPAPSNAPAHRRVAHGDLVALVSVEESGSLPDYIPAQPGRLRESTRALLEREAEAGLRHKRILASYSEVSAIIPFYFGGVLPSCRAISESLACNFAAYRDMLNRLSGCAEYGLATYDRVRWGKDAAPEQENAARERAVTATLQSLFGAQLPFVQEVAQRCLPADTSTTELDVALLVPHSSIEQLGRLYQAYQGNLTRLGVDLVLTGPWPPFSFTYPNRLQPPVLDRAER